MSDKICFDSGSVYENGYGIIAKKVMIDPRLTIEAKAIYAYLVSYAGAGETCFPGYEIILHHLNISKDRFYKHRKLLIQYGYIRVDQEVENGVFKRNIYTILTSSPFPCFTEAENPTTGNKETSNNSLKNNILNINRDNDNGATPGGGCSSYFSNQDVVKAMAAYMNDLYARKTGKKHPRLKPEQYRKAYDNMAAFCAEWCTEYDALIDMMVQFLNSGIESDWNLLHFATEGIMTNRMYEVAY